ncbi:MAG: DegT/DnrJ/EryC1/StrS family aminotransferase [Verrucomicrobia bacterium]|nr:DegT/DnrJ/EryC1/StrS family aminotransferase [Verrucomicrobiota bacterium]
MPKRTKMNRRKFVASTSALLAATQFPSLQAQEITAKADQLAVNGGERAVKTPISKLTRWGQEEAKQLASIISQDSLFYWKGPQTTLLTKRFQEHYPFKHVMPCSSGTAALHIAVAAAGIKPGDEIITAPITDMGTVIGAIFQQAVPVFADLEPNTYNLDPADVERRITPKTKAIIAVHLAGNPCRLNELKTICTRHKLILIEDCAQAWGAKYRGQPIGTIGDIACFSLQQSKHITTGDGGIVATNNDKFGPLLQLFGDKGFDRVNPKAPTEFFGTNYRMSELQAAFGAAQMLRVEGIAETRSKLGQLLTSEIADIRGITSPEVSQKDRCTFWLYMLRVTPENLKCDRAEFVKALQAEGVACSAGYISELIHEKPIFQKHSFFNGSWPVKEAGLTNMDYTKIKCPEASQMLTTFVRIQLHEGMNESYIREVATAIRKVARHFAG